MPWAMVLTARSDGLTMQADQSDWPLDASTDCCILEKSCNTALHPSALPQ